MSAYREVYVSAPYMPLERLSIDSLVMAYHELKMAQAGAQARLRMVQIRTQILLRSPEVEELL